MVYLLKWNEQENNSDEGASAMSNNLAVFEFDTRKFYVRTGLTHALRRQTEICMLATEQVFLAAGVDSHDLLSKPLRAEGWLWFCVLNQLRTHFSSLYSRIFQLCVDTHKGVNVMALRFGVPYTVMIEIIDASRAKDGMRGAAIHDVASRIDSSNPMSASLSRN
jgi:hypothetical protein